MIVKYVKNHAFALQKFLLPWLTNLSLSKTTHFSEEMTNSTQDSTVKLLSKCVTNYSAKHINKPTYSRLLLSNTYLKFYMEWTCCTD